MRLSIASCLALMWLLIGCAPAEKNERREGPKELTISEIPKWCTAFVEPGTSQINTGAHEFQSGIHHAVALDCGIREGKRCTYYIQTPDNAVSKQDVRCLEISP